MSVCLFVSLSLRPSPFPSVFSNRLRPVAPLSLALGVEGSDTPSSRPSKHKDGLWRRGCRSSNLDISSSVSASGLSSLALSLPLTAQTSGTWAAMGLTVNPLLHAHDANDRGDSDNVLTTSSSSSSTTITTVSATSVSSTSPTTPGTSSYLVRARSLSNTFSLFGRGAIPLSSSSGLPRFLCPLSCCGLSDSNITDIANVFYGIVRTVANTGKGKEMGVFRWIGEADSVVEISPAETKTLTTSSSPSPPTSTVESKHSSTAISLTFASITDAMTKLRSTHGGEGLASLAAPPSLTASVPTISAYHLATHFGASLSSSSSLSSRLSPKPIPTISSSPVPPSLLYYLLSVFSMAPYLVVKHALNRTASAASGVPPSFLLPLSYVSPIQSPYPFVAPSLANLSASSAPPQSPSLAPLAHTVALPDLVCGLALITRDSLDLVSSPTTLSPSERNITPHLAELVYLAFDADRDGTLSRSEFLLLLVCPLFPPSFPPVFCSGPVLMSLSVIVCFHSALNAYWILFRSHFGFIPPFILFFFLFSFPSSLLVYPLRCTCNPPSVRQI